MHRHDDVEWVDMKTARSALGVSLKTAYRLALRDAWPTSVDNNGRKAYLMDAIRKTARRRRDEDLAKVRVAPGHEVFVKLLEFERRNPDRGGRKEERIRQQFGLTGTRYWQMIYAALEHDDVVATNPETAARIRDDAKQRAAIRLARSILPADIRPNL
ncbi:DUF3263 domain-containing protein [Clavibacter michiganensis subsp. michiganensis]|uniref:DUF3263 domain-containing protein n=1 Tax=Clavibacter michiganensis TaxID=28447 RepID=UPI001C6470DC|nr:DUF3263 domain-containing protein [Clavibacter michiganensis]MBW8025315.1 DUF3263 domain-containing protein [Clavibacter michiganensis subsp. michiganensis]